MPNVPEASAAFDAIFEPEESLAGVRSAGGFWSSDQREELQIRYRGALAVMPVYPLPGEQPTPPPQKP